MARCGCSGSCSCVVRGAAPITVTGNGSVQQPYLISLGQDGQTGCEAITACVAQNLGPGLTYDKGTGKIQAKLSRDAGQTLRFGSDGGLLDTAGGAPSPESCGRTIDSLPAAPDVIGAYALAGLHNPYSSPYGVDYCVAHQVDIIGMSVATTADDVGVVADYDDCKITDGRSSIYVTQDIRQLSAGTVASTYNYAGDVNDPISYQRPQGAPRSDRRGGWYGWLAQRYHQPLLTDMLRRIGGKSVAMLQCHPSDTAEVSEAVNIRGAIRAVLQECAQPWAIIAVRELESATTVTHAGITTCIVPPLATTYASKTVPIPAADVVASGATWVILDDLYHNSVFKAYKDVGLQVLMWGNSRQGWKARAASLGLRGMYVLDPVYCRGPQEGGYDYRAEYDPWEHRRMGTGQLTYRTDHRDVLSTGGYVRGRTDAAEQGLILPANFGDGQGRPSVLVGWLCPLKDPTDYTITWAMRWNSLPGAGAQAAKMGLLFGAETDLDPYAWAQNNAELNPLKYPVGPQTMYRAYQRTTGEIGLAKWPSATDPVEYLATKSTPAIAANVWNDYELRVQPDKITFTRITADGTRHTVTTADTQYRGSFFFLEKEESFAGEPAHPFAAQVKNMSSRVGG
ncbi:hypothetical protein [Streptomyces sp. NPDC048644]|uniref:hypothetical protein n=1 Tax=Streptomyces sp. NPDC048644 TaxID=3365582 RepID=UPI003716E3A5